MPSITIKMPETAVKTTGVKPFDGFKNDGGYQALAKGVDAAGAQLKDILIKRQEIINAVIQEEYNTESQRIVNDFMARQKAEAEKKGVPLTAEAMQKSAPFLLEELTTGTKHITEKGNGDFRRRMEAMPAQTVKNLSPELNRLDHQKQDTRTKYSVEKDVIELIQRGDMKAAEEKLSYYVKIGAISEADKARILAEAPHTQAAFHAQQMMGTSPGNFIEAVNQNDPRLAGLTEEERAQMLAAAKGERTYNRQDFARNVMQARYGVSDQPLSAYLARAVANKEITQTQREAIEQDRYGDFFGEMWKEDPSSFDFLTPEEKARAEQGDMSVFDKFKDGAELIRRITTRANDIANNPQSEAQLRMMLKLSGVHADHVNHILEKINLPKKDNALVLENSIWFRKYSDQFAQDTYLNADSPEARAHGAKAYIEGLEDFHSRVKMANPNTLTPKEIERIYRECLAKVMGFTGEDGGGKVDTQLNKK